MLQLPVQWMNLLFVRCKMKIHVHDDQFDGALHPWCGYGNHAVTEPVFEATDPKLRCKICDREWFPGGQPNWHLEQAKEKLNDSLR